MELRRTFNTDEYNYDKSRPAYPKELFEDIFDYVKLSGNSNVLEIGIGTGQATLPFLNKGCNVTAVELGDKLSRYCAQKFSYFDKFNIINSDFIEADLPEKVRKAFENDMRQAIDSVGRVINIYDTIDLYLNNYNISN